MMNIKNEKKGEVKETGKSDRQVGTTRHKENERSWTGENTEERQLARKYKEDLIKGKTVLDLLVYRGKK
jgi:hypothetical protein